MNTKLVLPALIIVMMGAAFLESFAANSPVKIGRWPEYRRGPFERVALAGNHAFATTQTGVQVIEFTDPAKPRRVGGFDAERTVADIAVAGAKAIIAEPLSGVRVFDISQPPTMRELGKLRMANGGGAERIAVKGSLIVAGTINPRALVTLDISDPAHPQKLGSMPMAGQITAIATDGKLAIVGHLGDWQTAPDSGLQIVDVSVPAVPRTLATFFYPGTFPGSIWTHDVALGGGYAYALQVSSDGSGGARSHLHILDLADAAKPVEVARFEVEGSGRSFALDGDNAYVSFSSVPESYFQVLDLTDKRKPVEKGRLAGVGSNGIHVENGRVAAADYPGVQWLDVSDTTNPRRLGSFREGSGQGLEVAGNHAYLADGHGGLRIFDIADPTRATPIGHHETTANATDVALVGSYACLTLGSSIRIVDVADPRNPRFVKDLPATNATSVAASGQFNFVADYNAGLRAIYVSASGESRQMGFLPLKAPFTKIALSGGLACLSAGEDGWYVVDARIALSPVLLAHHLGYISDVALSGRRAFVLEANSGLHIFDLTDPKAPTRLGGVAMVPGQVAFQISVSGDRAYLTRGNGFDVYDIADPTQPKFLWNLAPDAFTNVKEVAVSGSTIYAASASQGLLVFGEPQGPVIHSQLQSQNVKAGTSVAWVVNATGTIPLSYQWRKNGVPIPGATIARYAIASALPSHAGKYSVVVTDAKGSTMSNEAELAVEAKRYTITGGTTVAEGGGRWRVDWICTPAPTEELVVKISPKGGTAQVNKDYRLTSDTITFSPGSTFAPVIFNIMEDELVEGDETFVIGLAAESPLVEIVQPAEVTMTLRDGAGRLLFGNMPEFHESSGVVAIPVKRFPPATSRVTVDYETYTQGGATLPDATPGLDFQPVSGQLVFEPGETLKTFNLPILDDNAMEPREFFGIALKNPTGTDFIWENGPMTFLVNLNDDDGQFQFTLARHTWAEGIGIAPIKVQRTGPTDKTHRVDFTTLDGTARAGRDYTAVSGTLVFNPGDFTKLIDVPILNDDVIESSKTFSVRLTARADDWAVADPSEAEVTIADDDGVIGQPGKELNPVLVGRWPEFHQGPAGDVAVAGNYAYVAGFGLQIIDVSNPVQPRHVGKFSETTSVQAIALSGGHAYLADFNMGLLVLDLSNPVEPVRIGDSREALREGYADSREITVVDQRAYVSGVGNNSSGLRLWIYDVSKPSLPHLLGTYASDSGTPVAIAIAGGHAYIAGGSSGAPGSLGGAALTVVDVRDPANPRLAGSYGPGLWAAGIALSGTRAYLTGLADAVTVLDISNPANPRRVGGLTAPFQGGSAALAEGVLAVAGWRQTGQGHTLETVDLSDPVRPTLLGTAALRGESIQSTRIFTAGSNVFVAAHWEGLQIFDVSQARSPARLGVKETSGSTSGVAVSGHHAYVANGTDGLRILDVSNPAQPVAVAHYGTSSSVQSVALAGNLALLGDAGWGGPGEGIVVLDVRDPSRPAKVGSYRIEPSPFHLHTVISGRYAFVANTWYQASATGRLLVLDIADPARPKLAGSFNVEGYAQYVAVSGSHAFLVENTVHPQLNLQPTRGRLHVIDATNPSRLARTATYDADTPVQGLAVSGDYCYLALQDPFAIGGRLVVLDVRDRSKAVEIASVDVSFPEGLAIEGNLLYVNRRYAGIDLFDISAPAFPRRIGASSLPYRGYQVAEPWFFGVAVADGYVYAPNSFAGLSILDTSSRISFAGSSFSANEEDGAAKIRVQRSGVTSFPVQVEWSAKSGTATDGVDFPTGTSGVVNFPSGVTEQTFTVPILDDSLAEQPEAVLLQLSNPTTGGLLGATASAELVVRDGSDLIEFEAAQISVRENEGKLDLTVRRRESDHSGTVSVELTTTSGTATADQNYTTLKTKLTFDPGETTKTVSIAILDNSILDGDKTFEAVLQNVSPGAGTGTAKTVVTILDDEGRFEFAQPRYDVFEGSGFATIEVHRIGVAGRSASVDFASADGTAITGVDFVGVSGTISFQADETVKTIMVPILNDSVIERNESFTLRLITRAGEPVAAPGVAEVTIVDDDTFTGQPGRELNPVLVGRWPGYRRGVAREVVSKGNVAFVVIDGGMEILDLRDPASPLHIGEYLGIGEWSAVGVVGDFVVLASNFTGLEVLDVADPRNPRAISTYSVRWNPTSITVDGTHAFVTEVWWTEDGPGGRLNIFDVTNPSNPLLLSKIDIRGAAHDGAVSGNFAFVATETSRPSDPVPRDAFMVVDISKLSDPRLVAVGDTGFVGRSVSVQGSLASIADGDGLTLFDISNPNIPRKLKRILAGEGIGSVAAVGGLIYAASGSGNGKSGLRIINAEKPEAPQNAGFLSLPGLAYALPEVWVEGKRAFLTGGTSGIHVVDIADQPFLLGATEPAGQTVAVAATRDFLFLADEAKGIRSFDISTPAQPRQIASYDFPGAEHTLVLNGDRLYVSRHGFPQTDLFLILDVSKPAAMRRVGGYPSATFVYGQSIVGNRAYLAGQDAAIGRVGGRFEILDLSDEANPKLIGSLSTEFVLKSVAVAGRYAFATELRFIPGFPSAQLIVIDVAAPDAPKVVASFDVGGEAPTVTIVGNYAYLSGGTISNQTFERNFQVLDIAQPLQPRRVAVVPMGNNAEGIVVQDGLLFATSYWNSLVVFDVSIPTQIRQIGIYIDPRKQSHALTIAKGYAFVANRGDGLAAMPFMNSEQLNGLLCKQQGRGGRCFCAGEANC